MATINIYLTFKGNCEEAFNFYKSVLGGEFTFVGRYKDMPAESNTCPPEDENKIMHVSLPISKETVLMGCDTIESPGNELKFGNNFSVFVNTGTREEADRIFNGLSTDGTTIMPMNNTFWGSYFGMLIDPFGINWMVSFEESTQEQQ